MEPAIITDTAEFWQTGPVPGIPALLQPVAHTLLQVRRELNALATEIPATSLWKTAAGLASPGFHLQHMTGVLDRLFTYARGSALDSGQFEQLAAEGKAEHATAEQLVDRFNRQVELAIQQLRGTDPEHLTEVRYAGRKKIPSTQLGLLFHAAEHLMRHTGQLLVTTRFLARP